MTLTSTTCGDHLARKSWRERDWDALILHMVHKSLGAVGMIPRGADSTQYNEMVSCGCECKLANHCVGYIL